MPERDLFWLLVRCEVNVLYRSRRQPLCPFVINLLANRHFGQRGWDRGFMGRVGLLGPSACDQGWLQMFGWLGGLFLDGRDVGGKKKKAKRCCDSPLTLSFTLSTTQKVNSLLTLQTNCCKSLFSLPFTLFDFIFYFVTS